MAASKKNTGKGNSTRSASKKRVTSKKNNSRSKKQDQGIFNNPIFVHGVAFGFLILFSGLFMYIDRDSFIAGGIRYFFGGLFGIMAYFIPLLFLGTLIYLIYTKDIKKMWAKFALSLGAIVDMCAIISLFSGDSVENAFYYSGSYVSGGGLIGAFLANNFSKLIGNIGTAIVLMITFVVLGCLITNFNIVPYIVYLSKRICGFSTEVGDRVKQKNMEREERLRQMIEDEDELRRERAERRESFNDYEEKAETVKSKHVFTVPENDDELPLGLMERIGKKSKAKPQNPESINIANDFANDLDHKDSVPTLFDDPVTEEDLYNMRFDLPAEEEPDVKTGISSEQDTEDIPLEINEMEQPAKAEQTHPKEKNLTDEEKAAFSDELDDSISAEVVKYEFPTLDLLDKPKQISNDKRQELYRRAEQLISVLDNFGVKAKPVQVTQGPTVTRYEIQPSSGTKLSKIVGLSDDIAMNLAVSTVLIAPVPGKAATVGVEIPNTNVTSVTIRELLESPEFKNAKSKLTVCLGKDIGGNVVVGDIAKWPHALIAGATGSGKSVCINTIITSILYKADPNEVKLIMVDPKQVELGVYNGIPHLLIPVVTEAKKAAGALNWAVQEMMRRYELFKNSGVRKLEMYNRLMEKTGGEKLPQLVIIIDELADLMMVAAKEVEDYICRLAQLARAAGIYLIIATQRPSVDVITGLIKANIPSRIAMFVSSQVDSRTIIDKAGAEKLLGNGDMLYFPAGARSTTRVQGAFVSDDEVERIVDFIKETSPETHYREDLAEHIERIQLGENGVTPDKDDDDDPLLKEAIQLAVDLGKISTSMVQRRLSVGYSRAGRIIDTMEARGIISPANGAKPREVLISRADIPLGGAADTFDEDVEE